jgi:hypothetical protein
VPKSLSCRGNIKNLNEEASRADIGYSKETA